MMHWYNGYGFVHGGVAMMIVMALLLVGVAVVVTLLVLRGRRDDTPSRLLEERRVRDEIDAEEFERVRGLLRKR